MAGAPERKISKAIRAIDAQAIAISVERRQPRASSMPAPGCR